MSMANETRNISEKDDTNFFIRFIKYFVPWRGDPKSEVMRKIIFIFSIFLFAFSLNELTDFLQSDASELNYAQEIVKYEPDFDTIDLTKDTDDESSDTAPEADGARIIQDWAKPLLERNSEVVGWIKIPGFVNSDGEEYINFPVLQHVTDDTSVGNSYYLTRNIDQQYYESGSIFADCLVPINEEGQADNITIYGHHMRKLGTSFTHLAEYKDGIDFLKEHPIVEFNTIYDSGEQYIIIGCFVAAIEDYQDDVPIFDYWRYRNFNDDDYTFESWIDNVRKQSWYSVDVDCTADDDYITLSTCSNEVADMRWVIVAKKLTADDNLDLIMASYAEKDDQDIYFPKCWRNVWGNNKKYLGWSY